MAPASPTLTGSVRRAPALLELVAEHHELTAKRLSRMTGLPLATTYHLPRPAVEEWADFRATAHAHALGQCLLAQLDPEARREETVLRLRARLERALRSRAFTVLT